MILGKYEAEKLLVLIYEMKYLHRKQLEAFHVMLVSVSIGKIIPQNDEQLGSQQR